MKSQLLCTCAAVIFSILGDASLNAQGTAFTYQGQLQTANGLAHGTYNLEFSLYATNNSGTPIVEPVTNNSVVITNGLLTVTMDFGSSVWNGETNWLQIGVESNGGSGFTMLSPREEVTPVPYTIYSENSTTLASGAAMGGGSGNSISTSSTTYAFVGGGADNTIDTSSSEAFIGAGQSNTVSGPFAFVGAGQSNQSLAPGATVAGGQNNSAGGTNGFIGAGAFNSDFDYDVVCGGQSNNISAGESFIGGGTGNSIGSSSTDCGIVDGSYNQIDNNAPNAFIGGGQNNVIDGSGSFIGAGSGNSVAGANSSISGGFENDIVSSSTPNTIGGGTSNEISNYTGFSPGNDTIAGGIGNDIRGALESTISGGEGNYINYENVYSTIGGGVGNFLDSKYGTIPGGCSNYITAANDGGTDSPGPTISGGVGNHISGSGGATISGGSFNQITGNGEGFSADTTVAGGYENTIGVNSFSSAISGGASNSINGSYSEIPGGLNNVATNLAFAAGINAQAETAGSFVWSDGTGTTTASFNTNQFMARASGGVVFLTGTAASPTSYATGSAGVALLPGATAWSTVSDCNAKKNFEPVDTVGLLNKLAAIPIMQWNYKWEKDTDVPNIGPMAQDFKQAFFPGRDDRSISTLEFDGVELAAIQGLNQKLEADNAGLRQENNSLAKRLDELEAEVKLLEQRN